MSGFAICCQLLAQSSGPWHAESFGEAIVATFVFGLAGVFLAVAGFKIFDWLTPGNLDKEILEKQNVAAAILAGAMIIGICLIIARTVG